LGRDGGGQAALSDPASALRAVADLGPFFAASADPAEEVDPTWRPVRDLYTDPRPLAERIDRVAAALPTEEPRVAASIAYQGLAARLVSPLIAVASVVGVAPPWSAGLLHWRPSAVGQWPLWLAAEERIEPVADLPAAVAEAVVRPHLVALAEAVRRLVGVSGRVLRGNAASAVVGAGRQVARARPDAAARAEAIVRAVLGAAELAGCGTLGPRWAFRRRSCCLYYRVAGGGLCADCVLPSPPTPPAAVRR